MSFFSSIANAVGDIFSSPIGIAAAVAAPFLAPAAAAAELTAGEIFAAGVEDIAFGEIAGSALASGAVFEAGVEDILFGDAASVAAASGAVFEAGVEDIAFGPLVSEPISIGRVLGAVADFFTPQTEEERQIKEATGRVLGAVMPGAAITAGGRAVSALGSILTGVRAAGAGAGLISTATAAGGAAIRGIIDSAGKFFSNAKVLQMAKQWGIPAAAAALGVSATLVAESLAAGLGKGRRRRGLSYRDIRTAKRTCRTISSMQRSLAACVGRGGGARRRLPSHGHRVVPT